MALRWRAFTSSKNNPFLRLCPPVHKRKNWIHLGSKKAGPQVANILSTVETCRRLAPPVREYLGPVLPGLADCPVQRGRGTQAPRVWAAQK